MRIAPEWRGPPPPAGEVEIVAIRGCDVAPVDLSDPAEALRLKAYVWPDAAERMARIEAAARLAAREAAAARAQGRRRLRRGAARDAAGSRASPACSTTRSMWQYLPETTRRSITAAMEQAGRARHAERPLAWVAARDQPRDLPPRADGALLARRRGAGHAVRSAPARRLDRVARRAARLMRAQEA